MGLFDFFKSSEVNYCKNCGVIIQSEFKICFDCNNKNKSSEILETSKLDDTIDNLISKNWSNKIIPNSFGEYGLVKTNPIALTNIPTTYGWLSLLRYSYTSKYGFTIYFPVEPKRIGSTDCDEIKGLTDIWDLYDINGSKLNTIFINCHQNFNSLKAPVGLFLSAEIDSERDAENVFEKFLKLSDEEKNNIDEESFNKLRRV